ncbi:MAG: DNA alkylation repair protein [Acidobacteria bacterium]|nr:DNA alkylation repair protein [Acidobacteriota bacterium]
MTRDEVLKELTSLAKPHILEYNARVGLGDARSLGIPTPELKKLASVIKKAAADRHTLAGELWATGSYDARVIAFMVDDPRLVSEKADGELA